MINNNNIIIFNIIMLTLFISVCIFINYDYYFVIIIYEY